VTAAGTGAVAVVLAAGQGERMGFGGPKAFVAVGGRPIVVHAVEAASACLEVDALVVAVPSGFEERTGGVVTGVSKPVIVVEGGDDRQASVRRCLSALPYESEAVVVHDAARPFASTGLFSSVLGALAGVEGVVPVVPVADTVKRVRDDMVAETLDRGELVLAQTPQAFVTTALLLAHERAADEGASFTDDAALVEWAGYRVRTVPGDPANWKITTAEDLGRAELSLAEWQRREADR
jgi:2-C-methyl-D-erythritol 4-phosphate cytidylyltransferase